MRDRGLHKTDFTLQAFAAAGAHLSLDRVSTSLPFSVDIAGSLTAKNAGGRVGLPTWIDNPQYKLVVGSSQARQSLERSLRVTLQGDAEMAWNIAVLHGQGEPVSE
jgi:hypothetical protein